MNNLPVKEMNDVKEVSGMYGEDNVTQPVKEIDPTTNYYGQQKTEIDSIQRAIDKSWGNRHANLLNESDDHRDTQGESNLIDRLKAMARRMGKVY